MASVLYQIVVVAFASYLAWFWLRLGLSPRQINYFSILFGIALLALAAGNEPAGTTTHRIELLRRIRATLLERLEMGLSLAELLLVFGEFGIVPSAGDVLALENVAGGTHALGTFGEWGAPVTAERVDCTLQSLVHIVPRVGRVFLQDLLSGGVAADECHAVLVHTRARAVSSASA